MICRNHICIVLQLFSQKTSPAATLSEWITELVSNYSNSSGLASISLLKTSASGKKLGSSPIASILACSITWM